VAPAVPNRSLNGDAAYVGAVLAAIDGPVVLVGHSYGCAVATVAGTAENVEGLVYLAGFVPDQGETLEQLQGRFGESDLAQALVVTPVPGGADLSVDVGKFRSVFAEDVDQERADVLAVSQRPLSAAAFAEPAAAAAWRDTPAWGVVATADRTINPDVERFGYERAGVATTEVASSHLVMLAHPDVAVALINDAVASVAN
jgi:pimeloyl-ACP methyl ester carboxylesterase